MSKRELIDEIVRLNPTAGPAFLAGFDEHDLAEYLNHLHWVFPAGRPPGPPAGGAADAAEAGAETAVAVADPPDEMPPEPWGRDDDRPGAADEAPDDPEDAADAKDAPEPRGSDSPDEGDDARDDADAPDTDTPARRAGSPFANPRSNEQRESWLF